MVNYQVQNKILNKFTRISIESVHSNW